MNQAWENGKKPSFGTDFGPFGPNLDPPNFFYGFYFYMLDIVASYDCMQFQGKLMNQTWENGRKPSFRTNFCHFGPNLGPQIFFMDFVSMLDIVASFHSMQFQGKLINQTWENGEKPSFGTDFGPFGPNLDSKIFSINFTLTIW